MIERNTVHKNGGAVLQERKYHGLLCDNGSFRLLAYCGKRFPLSRADAELAECAAERKKTAA